MNLLRPILIQTKFITTIDDFVRLGAMTFLALLAVLFFDIRGLPMFIILGIGVLIDLHDIAENLIEEKPVV